MWVIWRNQIVPELLRTVEICIPERSFRACNGFRPRSLEFFSIQGPQVATKNTIVCYFTEFSLNIGYYWL
ncbi:hypothetical protein V22_04100 [Calycomorphotria hydatis]|uniref:Uncharacterized protein n=1 Tax=Calycomorphotria hydatis TaxID=2528027 RepID=A0A517T497_9PLAN|nr:hypothetical protein V22_04100 [Calycomorphotria hydatis]